HHPPIFFSSAERHHPILTSPDQQGRQTRRDTQQMRETGIMHERHPGQTRRLRTRLFQALELLRPLATIEIIEFCCRVLVMNCCEQMLRRHVLEEIENDTVSWTNAHRRHQHEFTK